MSDERQHQSPHATSMTVEVYLLPENFPFPNNPELPALYYPQAVTLDPADPAGSMENHFEHNGWGYSWRNGIFPYHHYHSTAHEVLGIASGSASVELGGQGGVIIDMKAGDALVIPAGVVLRNVRSSLDLIAVGAYPPGQVWDVNTGEDDERPRTDENIAKLPRPTSDPLLGIEGPLVVHWSSSPESPNRS